MSTKGAQPNMRNGLVVFVTTLAPLLLPSLPWWVRGLLVGLIVLGVLVHLLFKDAIAFQRAKSRKAAHRRKPSAGKSGVVEQTQQKRRETTRR